MDNRELYDWVKTRVDSMQPNYWLFVGYDNEPMHQPVYCRDWLLELLCMANNFSDRAKSFKNQKMHEYPLNRLRLVFKTNKTQKLLQETLDEISDLAGVATPVITRLVPKSHFFLIEAPSFWISTTVHLSFFTAQIKFDDLDTYVYSSGIKNGNYSQGVNVSKLTRRNWARVLGKLNVTHVSNSMTNDYHAQHSDNGFYSSLTRRNTRYFHQMYDLLETL